MKISYALAPLEKSIFLAGPTPRKPEVQSWRPEALSILEWLNFQGLVFVPESADGKPHNEYDHQVSWEWEALNQCTVAVFWVPRDLETMPAMITNVEFGMLASSGKMVFGFPPNAHKMSYLRALATRFNVPTYHTLTATLSAAVEKTNTKFGR